jgi:hypothetical protein
MIYEDGQTCTPSFINSFNFIKCVKIPGKITYLFVVHSSKCRRLRLYAVQRKADKLVNNEVGSMKQEMVKQSHYRPE